MSAESQKISPRPWAKAFLAFFGGDLIVRARTGHRRMVQQASHLPQKDKRFHRCTVCGITDRTHPDMDFRYCTQCHGQHGYCTEHIFNHEHVRPETEGQVPKA